MTTILTQSYNVGYNVHYLFRGATLLEIYKLRTHIVKPLASFRAAAPNLISLESIFATIFLFFLTVIFLFSYCALLISR